MPGQRLAGAHENARIARRLALVLVFRVAVRVIDADADDLLRVRHGRQEAHVGERHVGVGRLDELANGARAAALQQRAQVRELGQALPEVAETAVLQRPDRVPLVDGKGRELHPAASPSRSPARRSTPSSRSATSGVAGTFGSRWLFSASSPMRFIMYFTG